MLTQAEIKVVADRALVYPKGWAKAWFVYGSGVNDYRTAALMQAGEVPVEDY